jgi:FlaG/FlaF family flagellin (archaellin)
MSESSDSDRGLTPLIGNILLVGVAVVIAVVLIVLSFSFLEQTGAPTAEATFEYQQTPAGLRMIPTALGTDAIVKLNGERVAEIEADSAGESVLLPTKPGDRITVVAADGRQTVLVDKTVDDRSEIGDLIAVYDFESESGSTVVDRSGNGNDGDVRGNPTWQSSSMRFDGSGDYVEVTDISSPEPVDEFTIAVAYETDTDSRKQELVEHISGTDNWLLELKPCSRSDTPCSGSGGYEPVYSVDRASGSQSGQIFGGKLAADTEHVVVGTYDGSNYTLYVDGQSKDSETFTGEISMGDMTIGRDAEFDGDYLDGRISEVRLYYTSFDDQQVRVVTNAMD